MEMRSASTLEIEPLWGMKEVTQYLGVSRTTAWRLIHQHGLPYSKLGGETSPMRFRPEEVRDWVIRNEAIHELVQRREAS